MLQVKIIEVPGSVQEVALEDGATVADALTVAGVSADGYKITVDNRPASTSTSISNGSRIIVAKAAKGNNS